jgi:hypothetical protein
MNLNKKIGYLLDSGLSPNFVSSMNESTINTLYNRLVENKKKETTEQAASTNVQKINIPASTAYKVPSGGEVDINNVKVTNQGGVATVMPTSGKPVTETEEIDEKFESKAQQGLFWAKCKKCKSDDCKWCKMAKEFSKSTSKKQYEKMPEKKHPEKTVKYKKNTNEEFTMANYFDKVASVHANNAVGKLTKEEIIKKQIDKIVETNLNPTMKKRELLRLIESQSNLKRKVNEDFYFDDEMEEAVEDFYFNPEMKESSIYAEPETDVEVIKKYGDEEESEMEEREPTDVVVVEDCKSGKKKFFIDMSEAGRGKFFMIETKNDQYCVQAVGVDFQSPNASVIDKFNSCSDCERNSGKGGGKEERVSYGIDRFSSEESKGGYREIGNPFEKMDIHKNIDPNEKMLPQGPHRKHKPMMGDISESFKKELNKINEILNRRNRYNNF